MLAHCSCGKRNLPSVKEWRLHFLNVTPRGNKSMVNKGGTEEHRLQHKAFRNKAIEQALTCMCYLLFNGYWDNQSCELHLRLKGKDPRKGIHPDSCICTPCLEVQRKGG